MTSLMIRKTGRLVLVATSAIVLALLVVAATASSTCDSSSASFSSSNALSDANDLEKRVANALDKHDGVSLTDEGRSLRATVDGVLSEEECRFLVEQLPPTAFVDAGGYESTSNKYNAPRDGYSGIGLNELAKGDTPVLRSRGDYERFLQFRERVRANTERALNLVPGTLKIDFTHVSQKTKGGTHRPHADNCFHYYHGAIDESATKSSVVAALDPTKKHPYSNRVAASIIYLNDRGYEGGEFYWASRSSEEGTPETIVSPREGRMTVFTSGIENLHGALPVREGGGESNQLSRRLALAMWYVTSDDPGEVVPEHGQITEGQTKEEVDPYRTPLFEIPVDSIKIGSLRNALGLFLVRRQSTPSRNSWRANQDNKNTLYMIFGDQTAMLSIVLKPSAIVVSRHTDGINRPSLMYQLQESVLLHGILTDLETLAFGKEAGNEFVKLEKSDVDKARSTLPTR